MQDVIKKDIASVLGDLIEILKLKEESDIGQIKILSNHVIHNASVFQDEDSISVAILIYSLSKIIERKQRDFNFDKILVMLNACITYLKSGQDEMFRKTVKNIFDFIRIVDQKLKLYIHEVINQAEIKKGCKLCEHGISVARAAEVLGVSQWELMHYLGKTTLVDQFSDPISISRRLKIARSLFL